MLAPDWAELVCLGTGCSQKLQGECTDTVNTGHSLYSHMHACTSEHFYFYAVLFVHAVSSSMCAIIHTFVHTQVGDTFFVRIFSLSEC